MPHLNDSYGSDDGDTGLSIQFKNHGRVRGRSGFPKASFGCKSKSEDIVNSLYSFTYKQSTGSLLSTRLSAMQRSMQSIDSEIVSEAVVSRLLTSLANSSKIHPDERISIPLDGQSRETYDEILEFLTVPYLDITPVDSFASTAHDAYPEPQFKKSYQDAPLSPTLSRPPIRPPSMLRRASSMVLNQSEMFQHMQNQQVQPIKHQHQHHNYPEGIPTPLESGTAKQAVGQAVFTTSAAYPFAIKTLNDIACRITENTFQDAQTRSFLEFVSPKMIRWLTEKVLSPDVMNSKTKLSGDLIELCSHLMSVCVEEPQSGVLMWIVEEVPSFPVINSIPSSAEFVQGISRVPSDDENIILQGDKGCWSPQAIGAAMVLDAETLNIVGYNTAALRAMLGLESSMVGRPFSELVPQFSGFWESVKSYCNTPGVVVPEHYFRHLAGISFSSPAFIAPNPSRHPEMSIRAVVHTSKNGENITTFTTYIDIQLRVVNPQLLVVWIGYSHTAAPTTVDLLPKIFSVMAATPPQTPRLTPLLTPKSSTDASPIPQPTEDYSELRAIKVGSRRRSLHFESFKELKLLGRGAYGEVRLVLTPSRRHLVVLKSIFKDRILVDTWSRDRELGTIPNEIKILNQLRSSHHPNIVELIDFFEDQKCYHMEMFPFGSPRAMDLFDYIETQSENVSPAFLLSIWQQIGSAVAHIHSIGIAHRDLKDENVIMDNDGNAKLIDFGSAAYTSQGPFDVFVGTVDYAAPEIVQGELYEGRPQDAWALGILLHIIMFKEPPFNGSDEIISARLPEDIPCLGNNIIRQLLSKNAEDRPTVEQALGCSHLAQ